MKHVVLDTGAKYPVDYKTADIVRAAMDKGETTVEFAPDGWRGARVVLSVARIVSIDSEISSW